MVSKKISIDSVILIQSIEKSRLADLQNNTWIYVVYDIMSILFASIEKISYFEVKIG